MEGPVLLTGWAGRVGEAILDRLGDRYEWRLFDREQPTADLPGEVVVGDLTDRETINRAITDVEAVIHLAGDSRTDAPWRSVLRNNIDGTQAILDAAAAAEVEKFVYASSNHAVGAYETPARIPEIYQQDDPFLLDGSEAYRPGNLYGVSKATGELLARFYHDSHDLSAICVRIGNLTKGHPPREYERGQAMWLSHRDCGHLFERCLEADYEFEIVYGISDNDRKYYSLDRAREVLDYDPVDNAADFLE